MESLLEQAKKFLEGNLFVNEIELTDCLGNKVRVVRNSPIIYPYNPFAYHWQSPSINPYTWLPY